MNKTMSRLLGRTTAFLSKKGSTILTCVAAVGVVATAFAVAEAVPKANDKLESARHDKGNELTKLEVFKEAAPVYIPVAVLGASTIACMFGANALNKKQQASIASAYALLSNYHKEYRNKLIEFHGEEADIQIREAMAREHCDFHQIGLDVPDQKVIFYDEISGESIVAYEREIMDAEYHLNRNFVMRGYASLNEFYTFLGLPQTEAGDALGWSAADGYSWIDFTHPKISKDDDCGTPVYLINMIFPPHDEYLDGWE